MPIKQTFATEKGIVPILALCLFLFCIIFIVVAVVVGLDRMQQEQTGESMFSEEANIRPLMEKVEKVKSGIASTFSRSAPKREQEPEPAVSRNPAADDGSGDALSDLEDRLHGTNADE